MATRGKVGTISLTLWTFLAFIHIVLASLNVEYFPTIEKAIFFTRTHFLSILVFLIVGAEFFLRFSKSIGVTLLAIKAENSNDPEELQTAITGLSLLGLYDFAIVGLQRLINIIPDSARTQSNLASMYGIQRRFLMAEKAARHAISLDPDDASGHFYLGLALGELGHTDEAHQCYLKAQKLGKNVPSVYFKSLQSTNTQERS